MAKSLHGFRRPALVGVGPAGIGGKLFEVSDQGFRQVSEAAVGGDDVSLGDQDDFVRLAKVVPFLGVHDGNIGDLKVAGKVFVFHRSKLWFESLAGRFLVVAVPSDVMSLETDAKRSFTDFRLVIRTSLEDRFVLAADE